MHDDTNDSGDANDDDVDVLFIDNVNDDNDIEKEAL